MQKAPCINESNYLREYPTPQSDSSLFILCLTPHESEGLTAPRLLSAGVLPGISGPMSRCDQKQAEYLTPWEGQVTWGTFYSGEKMHFDESNPK